MPHFEKPKNALLTALPEKTLRNLFPKFERFDLVFGECVYDPGDVLTDVYFVESGLISMLTVIDERSALEVNMVGSEGMAGLPVFLGITASKTRAVVQGAGVALRMKVADFLEECELRDDLPRIMRLFTYSILMQISRTAACNRFHAIEPRLARWLLMTQDRMKTSEFRITQDFMSYMLGVRREAVSKAANSFQQRKLISYVRGNFSILDRKGLEAIVCNCYQFISAN